MKVLEKFLDGQEWFAGDKVTIADLSILANIASIKVIRIIYLNLIKM